MYRVKIPREPLFLAGLSPVCFRDRKLTARFRSLRIPYRIVRRESNLGFVTLVCAPILDNRATTRRFDDRFATEIHRFLCKLACSVAAIILASK